MYRSTFYIGLFSLIVGVFGLSVPQSSSFITFMLPSGIIAAFDILLALILLHFSVFGSLRTESHKKKLTILGSIITFIAVLGLISPSYLGLLNQYANMTNLLVTTACGLGFLIAGLEYNRTSLDSFVRQATIDYRKKRGEKKSHLKEGVHVFKLLVAYSLKQQD